MANGVTVTTRMPFLDDSSYGPYAENNWHFSYTPLDSDPETCAIQGFAAIHEFWTGSPLTDATNMCSYRSGQLTSHLKGSWVDWEDPDNISHDLEDYDDLGAAATTSAPNEVACCITFKCDPYGGYRRQSFYNRVYLGPLAQLANTSGSTGPGRPSPSFRADIVAAYSLFQASLDDAGPDVARHAVFSPKHSTSGLVTAGWVDDAWDTIRRRGVDPTVKTSLVIA